jgi:quinol---cytochrome c reductase cytochrome c subunit, bacillus type
MAELAQQTPGQPQSQIDEAKRQKLLELVRGRALARPTDIADDEVMVWPSLVVVEAVSASIFLLLLTFFSIFINAPLLDRANPNRTPNPSKAPWYFLNLQELLLHMDKGLAGVTIPTLALIAIAAIPYVDRSPLGVGILGTSAKGRKITGFATVYTTVVLVVLILLDEFVGDGRGTVFGIGSWFRRTRLAEWLDENEPPWFWNLNLPRIIAEQVFPMIVMIGAIIGLVILTKLIFRPTRRELIIALFTGFFVTFIVLTIFGTSFRGEGQDLTWVWDLPTTHH